MRKRPKSASTPCAVRLADVDRRLFVCEQPRILELRHAAVDEIEVAAFVTLNWIEVFEASDVVRREPAILPPDGISLHAALVVPAQKPIHLEANEIFLSLLIRKQGFLQRLLPAHDPRIQRIFDEFKGLLLDVVEARFLQVADHMRRHTIEPRNLVDLELPCFKELCFFGRYGNLLILHTLLKNGDPACVHRAAVNGVPAFAQLRRVFQYARMLQDTARTRTVLEKCRTVFLRRKRDADGVLCHSDGRVADKTVETETRNVEHIFTPQTNLFLVLEARIFLRASGVCVIDFACAAVAADLHLVREQRIESKDMPSAVTQNLCVGIPYSIKREQPKALIYKDLGFSLMLFCRLFVA